VGDPFCRRSSRDANDDRHHPPQLLGVDPDALGLRARGPLADAAVQGWAVVLSPSLEINTKLRIASIGGIAVFALFYRASPGAVDPEPTTF
jgi:hypothetical protein